MQQPRQSSPLRRLLARLRAVLRPANPEYAAYRADERAGRWAGDGRD